MSDDRIIDIEVEEIDDIISDEDLMINDINIDDVDVMSTEDYQVYDEQIEKTDVDVGENDDNESKTDRSSPSQHSTAQISENPLESSISIASLAIDEGRLEEIREEKKQLMTESIEIREKHLEFDEKGNIIKPSFNKYYIESKPNPKQKAYLAYVGQQGREERADFLHHTKELPKCIHCPVRNMCKEAYKWSIKYKVTAKESKCILVFKGEDDKVDAMLRNLQAFTSEDPNALLTKMAGNFNDLEEQLTADPSFTKSMQLMYLTTNVYKMRHGEKNNHINQNVTSGQATVDIKQMMKEMRKEQAVDAISVEVEEKKD